MGKNSYPYKKDIKKATHPALQAPLSRGKLKQGSFPIRTLKIQEE
jgi:hypothetical protein